MYKSIFVVEFKMNTKISKFQKVYINFGFFSSPLLFHQADGESICRGSEWRTSSRSSDRDNRHSDRDSQISDKDSRISDRDSRISDRGDRRSLSDRDSRLSDVDGRISVASRASEPASDWCLYDVPPPPKSLPYGGMPDRSSLSTTRSSSTLE